MESKQNIDLVAIRILQDAASKVARSGAGRLEAAHALTTLHNAVFYLITGRAGVAHYAA